MEHPQHDTVFSSPNPLAHKFNWTTGHSVKNIQKEQELPADINKFGERFGYRILYNISWTRR